MEWIEIVKIERDTKKNYKIIFSNNSELTVHEDILVKQQLYKEKQISIEEFKSIESESEQQGIFQAAIRLISFRSRTAKELKLKLIEKGFREDSISVLIEKLIKTGYINHEEYANQFIRDAVKLKKKGLKWARYELLQRGINDEIISNALNGIEFDYEYEQIKPLAERKWDSYVRKYGDSYETKQRMKQFLERKGCSNTTINQIINDLND